MLGALRQGWRLKSDWLDPGAAQTAQPAFPPMAALEMRSRDLPSFQGGCPDPFVLSKPQMTVRPVACIWGPGIPQCTTCREPEQSQANGYP